MPSIATRFFDDLARRGHEPLLERVTAAVRFSLTDGDDAEHHVVIIDRGDIRVSTEDEPAGCVLVCDHDEFADLVAGRTSAMASMLRGTLAVDGDPELLVLAQRLLSTATTPITDPSGQR
jgi:putative sterol carrier protein